MAKAKTATVTEAPEAAAPEAWASPYDQALDQINGVADDEFRNALIDTLILAHVRRQKGFDDPAGPLAMKLRQIPARHCRSSPPK